MKRLAARSALFGALFVLTGCSVSIAREPLSDAPVPLTESAPAPSTTAPASPQNTAPPTDALTLEKPKSECDALSEKPCENKAKAERASMTARKVEAGRKAAAERKAVEQRKAAEQRKKAAALQRLTEERKAQESRLAEADRVANDAEERRLADKFKRAFERGRSAWLNAQ